MKARWAIFISGLGSNAAELLDARASHDISLVVSSQAQAPGLKRALRAGVDTLVLSQPVDWLDLLDKLRSQKITHIFLAGFMKVLPVEFLQNWRGEIVNVHPSLLPKYPGLKSIARAYQDRASVGVTTHQVVVEVDAGAILFQSALGDIQNELSSLEEIEWWAHLLEHRLVKSTLEAVG